MNVISDLNKDVITEKSAKLIGLLLNIEADAADGRSYTTRSIKGDDDEGQDGTGKNNDELHLYIPYLGVVKIARQDPISCEVYKPRQITPVELSQTDLFMLSVTFYCYLEFRVKQQHAHDYTTGLLCTTWSELSNSCSSIL